MVELCSDEKVLITSEKTLFNFYLSILVLLICVLGFIVQNLEITTLYDFLLFLAIPIIFIICLLIFKRNYDYSFDSSVSMTNKRFIFCKGNKEECVDFHDVHSISFRAKWIVVKDNSGKLYRAVAKNSALFEQNFLNTYPQGKTQLKHENSIVLFLIILALFGINKYVIPYLKKTPSPYIKISTADYMDKMQKKIKQNWQTDFCTSGAKVVVRYSILKNGEVSNIKIVESSSNSDLDTSAINALKQSSPFLGLPRQLRKEKDSIDLLFDFHCN